ncbi:uncharacterized protein PAC_12879 [Phialocephala subalpina]|uniref:Uncharacterized protein n=1 Tax=Phialocephala subalpina TaxID=576137 RepID=A0A1L7XD84_9HELO|nr:uncharacterized protein PAC_12879 [Phialocephala subalpina]
MTINLHKFAILQLLLVQIASSTVFYPNCSIPTQNSDFVSGPDVRSTLDILYGSLITIFLCTWTAQHLCLPPPPKEGTRYLLQICQSVWRKLKWMLVAIIMPEFMVGKALGDFIATYRSSRCEVMQKHARRSNTEWTMTHAFYANMGGVILREGASDQRANPCDSPFPSSALREDQSPSQPTSRTSITTRVLDRYLCRAVGVWSRQHDMWTEDDYLPKYPSSLTSFTLPVAVNSAHLCALISRGLIQQLPSISKIEIQDKSKEDLVVKALTLGQVGWFIIQLAVRKAKHLPCSQLEIAVLGFAICTCITYVLWLRKPKDIKVGTDVSTTHKLTVNDKVKIVWLNHSGFFENSLLGTTGRKPTLAIPNDIINMETTLFYYKEYHTLDGEDLGFIIGAVVFGACHCIAWDFDFPTAVEQTTWKATSIYTVAAMPVLYFSWAFLSWTKLIDKFDGLLRRALSCTTYGLYALCRVFIMVELFRSLAYLPPEAFLATWSASLPHVN